MTAAGLGMVAPLQATPFTIAVDFSGGGLTSTQQTIFSDAAGIWMGLLPEYQPGINITSLSIEATGVAIDGANGILGQAGPTFGTVQGGYFLATQGIMEFDTADLAVMEANGSLFAVILHEMAHVMGFGTLWTYNGVYTDGTGQYTGAHGLAAYRSEFNQPGAAFVPVELGGGPGTAGGHWNEVDGGAGATGIVSAQGDMRSELMTGWLNSSPYISNLTVQSFRDIGYLPFNSLTPVPEPGTWVLMGAGVTLIGAFRRRRAL
ncbi:MAG: PEP-CTERM sorting domain-containing protein [Bryobacterales bacterium]|nr:PEP-CTERM sorting domain-containing protein [Bryobacterales bacterium]